LVFTYSVVSGDLDADGIAVSSLALAGGATLRDAAGNDASLTLAGIAATTGVLVDGVPPNPPTISLDAGSDSGSSSSDALTNDTTPSFSGTAEANATITILVDGVADGTATADGAGNWSYTLAAALTNGSYSITATATDSENNTSAASTAVSVTIDTTAPSTASVTGPAAGSYKAGTTLTFSVAFDEAVTVSGTPGLALDIGGTLVEASYLSGSGSSTLVFSYTVQSGEDDADGVGLPGSITLNGGTLRDAAGNDASLSFTAQAALAGVVVDTTTPTITAGTVPTSGTYVAGQDLEFTVSFSEAVLVDTSGGIPVLSLTIGSTSRSATYVSGSGGTDLLFRYTVQAADADGNGITIDSLDLSGATLRDAAGNDAALTLAALPGTSGILIDAAPPTASTLEGPVSGTYKIGDTLTFTAAFSESVTTSGSPALLIDIGGVQRSAALTGSSNASNLIFTYAIQAGDLDSDGISILGFDLGSGSVLDLAGNAYDGSAAGTVSDTSQVLVDGVAPSVTAVSVPAAGAYKAGTTLDVTVTFSEALSLDTTGGQPSLAITLGSTVVTASYSGTSGTNGLIFSYTVQSGDTDADGIAIGALSLNGATLHDAAGNDAALTLNNVADSSGVLVDTTPPALSAPGWSAGLYGAGQTVAITLAFDAPVYVQGGTPYLEITLDGGVNAQASYVSGSGTGTLVFHYTPASGETAASGIDIAFGTADLGGATLRDAAGNDFTTGGNFTLAGIVIDTTPPAATGATITNAGGWYRAGDTLVFDIAFDEAVTQAGGGSATLDVDIGGTILSATLTGQPDTQTLRFSLTLPSGLQDTDGIRLSGGPVLNGMTLRDAAGNDATLTLSATDFAAVRVDSILPAVSDVIPPSAGTYVAGDTLDFTVVFAEDVTVSGTPSLTVQIGGTTRSLDYVSGSGTSQLLFRYTVQAGDFDNGAGVSLVTTLDGAAGVVDVAGNATPGTLPYIDGSLIRVDALPPEVQAVAVVGTPAANATELDFTITFSEPVASLTASDLLLVSPGLPDASISSITGSGTTYTVHVLAGSGTGSIAIGVQAGVLDLAGNALTADYAATATTPLDTVAPVLTTITAPADGQYGIGDTLTFTLVYSEAVQLSGTPVLQFSLDGATVEAALASGNGTDTLTFTWTVTEGSTTGSSPIYIGLSGTVVTDIAGNLPGTPTATTPGTSGIVVDGVRPTTPTLVLDTASGSDTGTPGDGITSALRPTLSGTSSGATALNLWRNGTLVDTIIPDGNGDWSFTEGSDLAEGSYSYTLQAVDQAGNTSSIATLAVTVDATAPGTPALSTLPGEAASGGGRLSASGDITLTGTAEAGSTVTVLVDGAEMGSAVANGSGVWTLDISLGDGDYSLSAYATDAAGNEGAEMTALALAVDTTAPDLSLAAPLTLAENAAAGTLAGQALATDAQSVTFSLEGTAEALARFTIDSSTGQIRSLMPLDHEAAGSYALTIVATDAAGNVTSLDTSITVEDVNETPTASGSLALEADNTGALLLDPQAAASASDPDAGDSLTPSITTGPAHGTLVVQADGTLLYQAEFNYSGSDSFTYRLTDSGGLFTEVVVTVAVPFTGSTPTTASASSIETTSWRSSTAGNPSGTPSQEATPPDPMGTSGEQNLADSFQAVLRPAGQLGSGQSSFEALINAGTGQTRSNLAEQGGSGTLPGEPKPEEKLEEAPAPRPFGTPGSPQAEAGPQDGAADGTALAGRGAMPAEPAAEEAGPESRVAELPDGPAWTGWQEEISLAAGRFERERDALLATLRSLAGIPPTPPHA
ncbi:Ig-like domain-containing protein, partial [Roseomonas sp. GC11]|uniref:beta strand repeat-containing protein n=1 Tax=Roseomonas sp. GC11 TaxID=2950546 RepID=UPI00272DEFB7